jgi:nickel-dependent lactate racemase
MRAILQVGYTKLLMGPEVGLNELVTMVNNMNNVKLIAGNKYRVEKEDVQIIVVPDNAILPEEEEE